MLRPAISMLTAYDADLSSIYEIYVSLLIMRVQPLFKITSIHFPRKEKKKFLIIPTKDTKGR